MKNLTFAIITTTLFVVAVTPCDARPSGSVVKDKVRGISFRAPKEWVSIPIDPLDKMTIYKFQAAKPDRAKKIFSDWTASMDLFFFPPPGAITETENKDDGKEGKEGKEEEEEEEKTRQPQIRNYAEYVEVYLKGYRKLKVLGKPKKKKIKKIPVTFWDMMETIRFRNGKTLDQRYRTAVFHTSDGEFAMQFVYLDEHSKRHKSDVEKSIRSFTRIKKDAPSTAAVADGDLSADAAYIEEQKKKLSKGWYHFWSKNGNYMIFSNADKIFAREIARCLEGIRENYDAAFPGAPRIAWKPIVRVCRNQNEYYGYGGPRGSAGYWSDISKEFVFYNDTARGEKNTYLVLKHEAFHHFIHFYTGCKLGTWYDEGHAEYFAGGVFAGKRIKIKENPWRKTYIQRVLVANKHVPLKKLVNLSKREFYSNAGVCYAEAWSFVYFLREGRKGGVRMKKEWTEIPDLYLKNLITAFAEVEEANPDDRVGSDEVNMDLSPQAIRLATERTFKGWTDKDWQELEKAWIDFAR